MEVTHLQPQPLTDDQIEKKEEQKKKKKQTWDFTLKVLITVGLIILLIIGILLPIKLVPNAVSTLAINLKSAFSGSPYKIALDKSTINSGQSIRLSWSGVGPTDKGTYYFSYQCASGLQVVDQFADGTANAIACNTAFPFGSTATDTLELVATSDQIHTAKSQLSLSFLKMGSTVKQAIGNTTLTVNNPAITNTGTITVGTSTPAQTNSQTTTNSTSTQATSQTTAVATSSGATSSNTTTSSSNNSNGSYSSGGYTYPATTHTTVAPTQADLAITLIATGIINPTTGAFTPTQQISSTDMIAVRFRISNNGGTATGAWGFKATLPTTDPSKQQYVSPIQASIGPKSGVYYTLSMSGVLPGQNQIVITVDPDNSVIESTKANNILTINVFTGNSPIPIQSQSSNTIYTYPTTY